MRLCYNCTIFNKIYYINNNSKKCVKCVRSSCNYNLTIFSILIKRIYKEQICLKKSTQCVYKAKSTKKTIKFSKE